MNDTPSGDLTPPGPAMEPPRGGLSADEWIAANRPQPGYGGPPVPRPPVHPPAPSNDKALGWTGFGLALVFCFPLLPFAGAVLAVITLARRRFRPRWVAVLALLAGLGSTALQVAVVTSDDFWDGFRDAANNSLEEEAEDARRAGEPTEISPFKLRPGDCINDPAVKGLSVEEDVTYLSTVTLLPCRDKHDLEVYANLSIPGDDYPGQRAIDRVARGCVKAFGPYIGKSYARSDLESYYYFPSKQSWKVLGDKTVTCLAGHPKRQLRGSVEGSDR